MVDTRDGRRHGRDVRPIVALVELVPMAFGAGSIPFGAILARRRGVDIRKEGSGNIGATNVARVLGARLGLVVLLLDAGKGALPTYLAVRGHPPWLCAATGLAAILGHCFSPWLGWKGGKGVATALGVFAVLAPTAALVGIGVFAATLAATRVPALGSLSGALAIAVTLAVVGPSTYAGLAAVTVALLVYTHRQNLANLRAHLRKEPG